MDLFGLTRAYFGGGASGGVALGGVLGVVDDGGLTWPLDGASVDGVADGGVVLELEVSLLGDVVAPGGAEASGAGAAGAVAAVLAVEPVEAVEAMVWPDHQSFRARCAGEAFR
ncbi:MAG: hypothetical protein JWP28_1141 [Phenylobacterium sp.]|uniref:hypothetical protein n=1 Tax=Phenylobacterium sp. TaxID=1871053 RepID=UPI0026305DFD|nr:hypothetical protein [Phenylobacterium sp.]MDB5497110.1 hypothetical protein [Phenylobacterium sp.]